MHKDELTRVGHMLNAAREAMGFVQGLSRAELDRDRMLSLALVRCLEIIGEAATRVGEHTRAKYPGVPWRDIVGMRNWLIHTYFDINLDLVWDTVTRDLPPLIAELEKLPLPGSAH